MKLLDGGQSRRFPAARLVLCLILVTAAIGGLPTTSWACGGAVHHEVVDKEEVVKVHSRLENGNFIIERVEVLDYERLHELASQMLGGLYPIPQVHRGSR